MQRGNEPTTKTPKQMALNKPDRQQVVKVAESKGYGWNSDGTKLTNGNGGSVTFSSTGGSVTVNGTTYSSSSGAKKSTKW